MEKKKLRVLLNKPIYIGFKVLEISKFVIYWTQHPPQDDLQEWIWERIL
jgi:hypothetical protein